MIVVYHLMGIFEVRYATKWHKKAYIHLYNAKHTYVFLWVPHSTKRASWRIAFHPTNEVLEVRYATKWHKKNILIPIPLQTRCLSAAQNIYGEWHEMRVPCYGLL